MFEKEEGKVVITNSGTAGQEAKDQKGHKTVSSFGENKGNGLMGWRRKHQSEAD